MVGGVMFHTQRSLDEEGHVVCREYGEDWKRVGEGLVELTPCDGSLSPLLWGNFPQYFSSPRRRNHTRDAVLPTAIAGTAQGFAARGARHPRYTPIILPLGHPRSCVELWGEK